MDQITPQLQIQISTLVRTLLAGKQPVEQSSEAQVELTPNQLLDKLPPELIYKGFNQVFQEYIEKTERTVRTHDEMINLLYQKTTPSQMKLQYDQLFNRLIDMENQLRGFKNTFNDYVTNKFIEVVSDEEIRNLYLQSGLQLKNIQDEFNVEHSTAHRWVMGDVKDLVIRHKVKVYLLKAIKELIKIK